MHEVMGAQLAELGYLDPQPAPTPDRSRWPQLFRGSRPPKQLETRGSQTTKHRAKS